MNRMTSVYDVTVRLVVCLATLLLPEVIHHHAAAQGIVFGKTRNVDEIFEDTFGSSDGVVAIVNTRTSQGGGAPSCFTPEQQQGQCISVSECPVYMPLMRKIQEPGVSRFLRERICRLDVNNVRICCPDDPQSAALPSSDTTTTVSSFRPTQNTFLQPQPAPQNPNPVRISFGGPSGIPNPSQTLPLGPTQNLLPSGLPVQPPQTAQFLPTTTKITPQSTSGTSPITTQNTPLTTPGFQIQMPNVPPPLGLPVLPPQVPIILGTFHFENSSEPQILFTFAPNDLLPDRTDDGPSTSPSLPFLKDPPSNIIPSEEECGSSLLVDNLRSNGIPNWPWLVAVGYAEEGGKFEVMCGGAVITRKHIITAAHCLSSERFGDNVPTHVRLGDYDLGRGNDASNPQDILIEDHQTPGHDSSTFAKDIAIITLSEVISFNDFIQPVCLPYRYKYDGFRYQKLNVLGWRHTLLTKGRKELPQTPNQFDSTVLGLSECRTKYQRSSKSVIVNRKNFCIEGGNDETCLRDSGALASFFDGEITNKHFLVGIGSFGYGCDRPDEPYVYTRIGAYLDWIAEVITNEN